MEKQIFGYSAKQSAVASSLIIAPESETEQELQQFSESRSLPSLTFKTKAVLWIAELPTYCRFNRTASRLLDRAMLAAEAGRAAR